jgi:putative Ca2+/H+ antiporter (TMEM165/GDT1 family)
MAFVIRITEISRIRLDFPRLAKSLGGNVLRWGVGLTFLAVAVWALIPDRLTEKERRSDRYGAFVTALVSFFLVEIGDKTQIATAALAAHFGNVVAVVSGTTIGMLIADGPAVVLGNALAEKIPFRYVRYAAAVMFAVIGILALLGVGVPTGN